MNILAGASVLHVFTFAAKIFQVMKLFYAEVVKAPIIGIFIIKPVNAKDMKLIQVVIFLWFGFYFMKTFKKVMITVVVLSLSKQQKASVSGSGSIYKEYEC